MPSLSLYANSNDVESLTEWLNEEESIAFIVRPEPGRLIALPRVASLPDGRYCLWHSQSGQLPWFRLKRGIFGIKQIEESVPNPFDGWEESVTSADGGPWFGGGHTGTFWLQVQTASLEHGGGIGMTTFEWIGNHYSALGRRAPEVTKEWWESLRKMVKRRARRIPRSETMAGSDTGVYAMPGALEAITNGAWRDRNPGTG